MFPCDVLRKRIIFKIWRDCFIRFFNARISATILLEKMKIQLIILLTNIRLSFMKLLAVVGAFFLPISGILFLIGFAILLDTLTGIWKSKKLGIPIT